jgi:ATP-binding cassette subfamily F protein uup
VSPARPREKTSARLSYKESRELDALPERIAALETEQAEITRELADSALYRDQPDRVRELHQRYTQIENDLMARLTRWEELEARQSKG